MKLHRINYIYLYFGSSNVNFSSYISVQKK